MVLQRLCVLFHRELQFLMLASPITSLQHTSYELFMRLHLPVALPSHWFMENCRGGPDKVTKKLKSESCMVGLYINFSWSGDEGISFYKWFHKSSTCIITYKPERASNTKVNGNLTKFWIFSCLQQTAYYASVAIFLKPPMCKHNICNLARILFNHGDHLSTKR